MRSSVRVVPLDRVAGPAFVVALGELVDAKLPSSLLALDKNTEGELARLIATGDFTGAAGQLATVYPRRGAERLYLVGLGKPGEITRGAVRSAVALAARKVADVGAKALSVHVALETTHGGVPPTAVGQVVVEGFAQGAWRFSDLKADRGSRIGQLDLIVAREERSDVERGRRIGAAIANGHVLARNLQALPANICTPTYLANIARYLAKTHRHRVTVLGRAQLEKQGMNALLAVARGSQEEPRLILLEHRGGGRDAPICFVGKGVTFDSGGISIKPAENMHEMKYDMSGAAAVLGLFETLGHLKPKLNVIGIVPATENLPSGTAVKPGDIIRSHYGKTIEILNTDAEGRLILCDALSFARRYKPACVINAATLTGAIVVALGHHASGLMGNDDPLLGEVRRAGDMAGERCWPLPLWDEYREQLQSDVADVKNIGGRPASSITAGWFLREFVDGFPWAHLDIAGTAYTDKDRPDLGKGPTGVGVRLFSEFVLARNRG